MPEYIYVRRVSDAECKAAKDLLKDYYRWRYRTAPPREWNVDHQVEQFPTNYVRFGPDMIHSLSNIILVPSEVNWAKNVYYDKTWNNAPLEFRHPRFEMRVTTDSGENVVLEEDSIKARLAKITSCMDDEEAWAFQEAFSQSALRLAIDEVYNTIYKVNPPEWYQKYPHWLERLREDIEDHKRKIREYHHYLNERNKAKEQSGQFSTFA